MFTSNRAVADRAFFSSVVVWIIPLLEVQGCVLYTVSCSGRRNIRDFRDRNETANNPRRESRMFLQTPRVQVEHACHLHSKLFLKKN